MIKVAIITRTKGRLEFLRRALISVSNQSYQDYEHFIINDSGRDLDIREMLDNLPENYTDKVKIINRHEASNAPDTIFNESVDYSESHYVSIHDDDDTWHKDFLKITVEHLDSNKNIGGVVVRTDKVIEEIKLGRIRFIKKNQLMPHMKIVSLYQQCFENQLTPIAFVYRRDAYEKVGKYESSLPVCGDWEFGIRFLMNYDVDFIDPGHALANYHHRKVLKDNSFSQHSHRYYSNKIRNSYLRKELLSGQLGVGYIMSQINYEQDLIAGFAKKLLPKFVVKRFKKRIRD